MKPELFYRTEILNLWKCGISKIELFLRSSLVRQSMKFPVLTSWLHTITVCLFGTVENGRWQYELRWLLWRLHGNIYKSGSYGPLRPSLREDNLGKKVRKDLACTPLVKNLKWILVISILGTDSTNNFITTIFDVYIKLTFRWPLLTLMTSGDNNLAVWKCHKDIDFGISSIWDSRWSKITFWNF